MDTAVQKRMLGLPAPWAIVLVGAVLMFVLTVVSATFGVFFKPIASELHWGRGVVSMAMVFRSVTSGVLSLLVGYYADRLGPRKLLMPCSVALGVGLLLMSRVRNLPEFYATQALLGAATSGPFICVASSVARWHGPARWGRALGIAAAGTGVGTVVFPPLASALIDALQWRNAFLVLGLITMVISIPMGLLLKDPPVPSVPSPAAGKGPLSVFREFPRRLKDPLFLSILSMFALFYVACNLVTIHLVNYATDIGIEAIVAATMMSVMGVSSTGGRLILGTLSDRLGTKFDAAMCCGLVALSLVALGTAVVPLLWIGVILFGIGFGGAAPLIPAITGEHFGTEQLSTSTASFTVGGAIGSALGPLLGGFVYDYSGSYLIAIGTAGVLTFVALFLALRLPAPGHGRLAEGGR